MAELVKVEIAGLRSTAIDLDSGASSLDAIRTALDAAASGYEGCWGHDEYGDQFEGGDNGYKVRRPALENVLTSMSARLRQYSGGLSDGANTLERAEQNNTDGFRSS
ncbi:MAG: hypothetical protein JWN03_3697 [Nocardia sp.]|uniref:hypothetical protein n=1 Tax=Nocardia sp. TaxID=1821 RepID=UPI00261F41D6|nr:hypothetical protein [Nocardia sp.]MCU1643422.1 hypothetical protein [Nocardia sp.]